MRRAIPALFHWRPPHDPWTYTADGQYSERITKDDRRYLKKKTQRILDRIDREDYI